MKIVGQILLWAGFVAAALATVINAPAEGVDYVKSLASDSKEVSGFELQDLSEIKVPENGWHLIPWSWYSVGAAVSLIGVILLQIDRASANQKSEQSAASINEINSALTDVVSRTKPLSEECHGMAPSKIVSTIDDQIADDLRIFAEGRDSIAAEYGLEVFADVMTQFAAGERAINRAWSAAADGYVDEAASCVDRGHLLLSEALRILESAQQPSDVTDA